MLRLSDFRALRVTLLHAQKSPPKLRRLTKTENALPKRPTNSKSTELGIWHSSMMFDKNFSDRLILYTKSAEASNRLFKLTTFGQVVFLAGLAFMGYNHQQIEHLRIEALQEEYRLQQQEKEKLKAGTIDDDKHDEIQKTSLIASSVVGLANMYSRKDTAGPMRKVERNQVDIEAEFVPFYKSGFNWGLAIVGLIFLGVCNKQLQRQVQKISISNLPFKTCPETSNYILPPKFGIKTKEAAKIHITTCPTLFSKPQYFEYQLNEAKFNIQLKNKVEDWELVVDKRNYSLDRVKEEDGSVIYLDRERVFAYSNFKVIEA